MEVTDLQRRCSLKKCWLRSRLLRFTRTIFYNEAVKLLETLDIPEDYLLFKEKALPNTLLPSDHVRLQARFLVKEKFEY